MARPPRLCPLADDPELGRGGGKKSLAGIDTEYLDRVLKTFSGYLAIDELYDGPFCVISVVDNRIYQRLAYRVLEKSPTKGDVRRFLREFAARLAAHGCRVLGITTDGSSLYPRALAKVFPGVPHQICEFHVLKEITRAILHALAGLRKRWQAEIPKQPRGRPSRSRAKAARAPGGCNGASRICSRTVICSSGIICGLPRRRPCDE